MSPFAALALVASLVVGPPADDEPAPRPRLATDGRAVELPLDPRTVEVLERAPPDPARLDAAFLVFVAGSEVPILGRRERVGACLGFRPRFPFRPGTELLVRFDPSRLGLPGEAHDWPLEIPASPAGPPTRLLAIHPDRGEVPANLLRLYLEFSAPMSRGRAYDSVRLIDESTGREDPHAFLRLGEELWDPTGTRLTLLLDPGRVKRGLVPHAELGPVLRPGSTYRLVIRADWPDSRGLPLGRDTGRRFRAVARDDRPPDPSEWSIGEPAAGSTEPLRIDFHDPLDHALARRLIAIEGPHGQRLDGAIELSDADATWQFRPASPWAAGTYRLSIGPDLEDPSGNRIGQPFEVESTTPPAPARDRPFLRAFSVR